MLHKSRNTEIIQKLNYQKRADEKVIVLQAKHVEIRFALDGPRPDPLLLWKTLSPPGLCQAQERMKPSNFQSNS